MHSRRARWAAALVLAWLGACSRSSSVGLEVCDRFLARYSDCVRQIGPEARGAMQQTFERQRQSFATMAKDPARRAELTRLCEASLNAIVASCH